MEHLGGQVITVLVGEIGEAAQAMKAKMRSTRGGAGMAEDTRHSMTAKAEAAGDSRP